MKINDEWAGNTEIIKAMSKEKSDNNEKEGNPTILIVDSEIKVTLTKKKMVMIKFNVWKIKLMN